MIAANFTAEPDVWRPETLKEAIETLIDAALTGGTVWCGGKFMEAIFPKPGYRPEETGVVGFEPEHVEKRVWLMDAKHYPDEGELTYKFISPIDALDVVKTHWRGPR